MYTIITENDESEWNDETGLRYHFPNKYLSLLKPGTRVVYYKGRIQNQRFSDRRLAPYPHYFGIGRVSAIEQDPKSNKNYYAIITDYQAFDQPVDFKQNDKHIERIPPSKHLNYWWDGVRYATKGIYDRIVRLASIQMDDTGIEQSESTSILQVNALVETAKPSKIRSRIPKERTFKGRDKDWQASHSASIQLGSLGEQLVIKHEQSLLAKNGLNHLVEHVTKAKDGQGYDVHSFDAEGNDRFIEVKTTTNAIDEPFMLTLNEKDFATINADSYVLYRIYEYQPQTHAGKFYILKGSELLNKNLNPMQFEVSYDHE